MSHLLVRLGRWPLLPSVFSVHVLSWHWIPEVVYDAGLGLVCVLFWSEEVSPCNRI